jgi:hypothetical protein
MWSGADNNGIAHARSEGTTLALAASSLVQEVDVEEEEGDDDSDWGGGGIVGIDAFVDADVAIARPAVCFGQRFEGAQGEVRANHHQHRNRPFVISKSNCFIFFLCLIFLL